MRKYARGVCAHGGHCTLLGAQILEVFKGMRAGTGVPERRKSVEQTKGNITFSEVVLGPFRPKSGQVRSERFCRSTHEGSKGDHGNQPQINQTDGFLPNFARGACSTTATCRAASAQRGAKVLRKT